MKISQLKKFALVLGPCLVLNASLNSTTYAATDPSAQTNAILKHISDTTDVINTAVGNILNQLSNVPTYINNMVTYTVNMTQYDNSEATPIMQQQFATIGKGILDDLNSQSATFLGTANGTQPAVPLDTYMFPGATQFDIAQAPTLFYSTLLGSPVQLPPKPGPNGSPGTPETPVANPGLQFMMNAAGYSIFHPTPGGIRGKSRDEINRYASYFRTVVPVQSYNTYILSKLYAESQNKTLADAQKQLIARASDSRWMANISASEIGVVLRQMLMFQSQNYVLMTELVKAQKEMLTLQAMNNSLIIASNLLTEKQLMTNAQQTS